MINIDYSNHEIKVSVGNISQVFETPLTLKIISQVDEKEVWSSEMSDNWWATFPNNEINDVKIFDKKGNFIFGKQWNVIDDGSYLYKALYLYCNKKLTQGRKPKGIAIGTHDGKFGEWVPCVLHNKTDAILIEASEPQFEKLKKNYTHHKNTNLINSLITTDGKDVEFFEGGEGYTNSIVERVIRSWEKEEIKSSLKESQAINQLFTQKIDWLHTDVEGYDAQLIMAIEEKNLPPFIIFEHENLLDSEKSKFEIYLKGLGYSLDYQNVSCIAIK